MNQWKLTDLTVKNIFSLMNQWKFDWFRFREHIFVKWTKIFSECILLIWQLIDWSNENFVGLMKSFFVMWWGQFLVNSTKDVLLHCDLLNQNNISVEANKNIGWFKKMVQLNQIYIFCRHKNPWIGFYHLLTAKKCLVETNKILLNKINSLVGFTTLRKLECQPKHLEGKADYIWG